MMTPVLERAPNTHPAPESVMEVLVIRDFEELRRAVPAWDDLAANTREPNVFFEPWFLLAAVDLFQAEYELEFHLVFPSGHGPNSGDPFLTGFFPFERRQGYKRLPLKVLSVWKHMYGLLGTPLIRTGYERESLQTFLRHVRTTPGGPAVVEWTYLTSDGPIAKLLHESLAETGTAGFIDDAWERALLTTRHGKTGEEYIHDTLGRRRRKELKRQLNRLEETGPVEIFILEPGDDAYPQSDIEPWISNFLNLEASGWKGKEGSAFLSKPAHEKFFRTITREAHARDRLRMMSLTVGGKQVAASTDLLSGDGSFAFKIAYDESYSRFSPGVQLEIESIRRLHDRPEVTWMDSCAIRDHTMINRLCTGRRPLETMVTAARGPAGAAIVKSLPRLRELKQKLRPSKTNATSHETEADHESHE